jgi:hypothetical protein
MEIVKISELKTLYEQTKDIVAIGKEHIEFNDYASIYDLELYTEVHCLSDAIQKDENEFATINVFEKAISFVFVVLVAYTNVAPEIKGDYDFVMQSGLWQYIVDHFKGTDTLRNLEILINKTLEQKIKSINSIEASVIKVKNKLFELAEKVNTQLGKFDLKELQKVGKSLIKDLNKNPETINRLKDVLLINKETNGVK